MKKLALICAAAAAAVGCMGLTTNVLADADPIQKVTDADRTTLLGVKDPDAYYLGIAATFSVFVQEDFTADGSDCEGRLGAGGNANLGEVTPNYSVGAKLEEDANYAKVVVGGDTLVNFQPDGKKFVVGTATNIGQTILDYAKNGQAEIYEGQLIDFDKEFELLTQRSEALASLEDNATLEMDPDFKEEWIIRGEDDVLNVLTLDAEELELFNGGYLQMEIYMPEGAYLVINAGGKAVEMPTNTIVGYDLDGNELYTSDENMPVLFNLPEAETMHYTGSIFGSTLAPHADASGEEGGHVAGATFAKSFTGGIEFGYSLFDPSDLSMEDPSTETTTTAPATTVAAATTTETTAVTDDDASDAQTTTTAASDDSANDSQTTTGASSTVAGSTDTNTTTDSTASTTVTTSGTSTTSSPGTGDATSGGIFVAAGAALFLSCALRKKK